MVVVWPWHSHSKAISWSISLPLCFLHYLSPLHLFAFPSPSSLRLLRPLEWKIGIRPFPLHHLHSDRDSCQTWSSNRKIVVTGIPTWDEGFIVTLLETRRIFSKLPNWSKREFSQFLIPPWRKFIIIFRSFYGLFSVINEGRLVDPRLEGETWRTAEKWSPFSGTFSACTLLPSLWEFIGPWLLWKMLSLRHINPASLLFLLHILGASRGFIMWA